MRLYLFDDHRLGVGSVNHPDLLVDVTDVLTDHVCESVPRPDRMTALIEHWDALNAAVSKASLTRASDSGSLLTMRALADVQLLPPQPRPRLIAAAPVNYRRHQEEMGGEDGVYPGLVAHTIETYAGFVKASSSITGPSGAIELPFAGRRVDHEAELGVVIGKTASRVRAERAHDYIFGYTPLLDITLRGEEDRSYRKSFDTFTPIGPSIVTADEVRNPDALDITLTVNGEVRQSANTRDLIYGVPRLVELYSGAMTLQPGDIIATGTPEGVGMLASGDEVVLSIDTVGELKMPVTYREASVA